LGPRMKVDLIILAILVISALWAVMTRSLIRSAIGLALASAVLTVIMFRLSSPFAAVFELSVCAGLISVLFLSTISLTHPMTHQEAAQHQRERYSRYFVLPYILIVIGIIFAFVQVRPELKLPPAAAQTEVRVIMWNLRQVDLIGQAIILLTGVFGVVLLLKEARKK